MPRNFYDANGFRSSWITEGSGQKILFLPGWAESSNIWKESCAEFLNEYQKNFMDLGGHYPSEFPIHRNHITLEEFLSSHFEVINQIAGNDKLTLIGHSTGAFVFWNYVNQFPEKVDKTILVGSFLEGPLRGFGNMLGALRDWNLTFLIDLGLNFAQNSESLFFDFALSINPETKKDFLERADIQTLLPLFFQDYKKMNPKFLRIVLDILDRTRLSQMNLQDGLKINFIHGDKDPVVSYSRIKNFCAEYKTAKLYTIPGSGHSPQFENPTLFWNFVKEIINT